MDALADRLLDGSTNFTSLIAWLIVPEAELSTYSIRMEDEKGKEYLGEFATGNARMLNGSNREIAAALLDILKTFIPIPGINSSIQVSLVTFPTALVDC